MQKLLFLIFAVSSMMFFSCKKSSESVNVTNLTSVTWTSDSLLANGVVADGTGQMLEKFKGDAKFNKDGSGYFGKYTGTWKFTNLEKQIVIDSDSLMLPVTANIVLLNSTDFKLTTLYPNVINPASPIPIRMTFKAK